MTAGRHLRRARNGTLRFARATGEDAAELSAVFTQVARYQARDALTGRAGGALSAAHGRVDGALRAFARASAGVGRRLR